MEFDREEYFSAIEHSIGSKLSMRERKMAEDYASETGATAKDSAEFVVRTRKASGWNDWIPRVLIVAAILIGIRVYGYYDEHYSYAAQTLSDAQRVGDPMEARLIINSARMKCRDNFFWAACYPEKLEKASEQYLLDALNSGNPKALLELYTSTDLGLTRTKTAYRERVLNEAAASKNIDVLISAAEIYRDDKINIIDTEKEKHYRYLAWRAGDKSSAARLAQISLIQGDTYKAYLWSLRCILECERSYDIELGKLSQKLPPDALTTIQAKAQEAE